MLKKPESAALKRGYVQGQVGAHRDSGDEFVHGRSERLVGKRGHEVGKTVRSRVDSLTKPARGLPNQTTHA